MGCDCEKKIEEFEIQKDGNYYSQEEQNEQHSENQSGNRIKLNFHKRLPISPNLRALSTKEKPNMDFLLTITENNDTINREENNLEKQIIQEDEKENEENIDKSRPTDEFSQILLDEINKLREDPHSFIELIHNSEVNINTDKRKRLIYNSRVKVALNKGIKSFEEAKLLLSNTKPMEKLIFDYNMRIRVPKNEKDIKNKDYLRNQILIKNDTGMGIKSYWREIIYDPETCFILMIVDDNGKKAGMKRRDILNPKFKYIGISSGMINKSFACYITLK